MTETFDRRVLLLRGGRLVAGAGAALALPGWVAVGSRSAVDPRVVELAGLVEGTVVTPADATYDVARRLYSPRFDDVRPGAIVFCNSAQDVWRTVRWSRRHSIRVVARSGGHSYGGYSTCRGVVVDLSRLSAVTVDHAVGTASVGAGAKLIDVVQALFAQGVAIPSGSCPTVGIGGLTLGGGHGFSGRAWGLTCDNVRSLKIVTASGQLLLRATRSIRISSGLAAAGVQDSSASSPRSRLRHTRRATSSRTAQRGTGATPRRSSPRGRPGRRPHLTSSSRCAI